MSSALAIAAVVMLPSTAAAAGPISFSTPANHTVGITPYSVATADFDADGALDLVVPNRNSNTVSVLLGDGAGDFAEADSFAAGEGSVEVAIEDFNGDARPDLAVTDFEENAVSVLLGDGAGGFGPPTSFPAGEGALAVAADDFNGDDHPDLAVANFLSDDVSILLGDGAGAFAAPANIAVGGRPQSVAAGRFNGDAIPDLAVANSRDNDVSILLGDGTGGFVAVGDHAVGTTPMSLATGEFDNDPAGGTDLAVANFGSNNVSVLLGDGDGGFGAATTHATGGEPPWVAVADLDADGHDDITVPNSTDANVSVLLGEGAGSFEPQATFNVGLLPYGVAAGAFDGDPRLDLAVANIGTDNLSVLLQGAPDRRPSTTISSGPANGSVTADDDPSFAFTGAPPENTDHFECKLDDADFAACISPRAYTDLAEGSHTFSVRACNALGDCDGTPAARSWTIDRTAPQTQIDSGPAAGSTSADDDPSFGFSGSPGADVARFECKLDGADFANCAAPRAYSDLASGSHTFSVRACDTAGNCDSTAASRTWTVDTVAPETQLDGGPAAGSVTQDDDPRFQFSGSPVGDVHHFQCRIVPLAFGSCTSPLDLVDVAEGARTFEVRACDAVGNCDATPAARMWTIDRTPPDTLIAAGPAHNSTTNVTSPSFTFSGTPGDADRFECALDLAPFSTCTSPRAYSGLAQGTHTFAVRACDVAGNCDGSAAARAWTIDTTAPVTTIVSGPKRKLKITVSSTNVTFGFESDDPGAGFECGLDAKQFAACASPKRYRVKPGAHTFQVRAIDAAGNVGAAVGYAFKVIRK